MAQGSLSFTLQAFFLEGFALIVHFFAPANGDFYFDQSVLKVYFQRQHALSVALECPPNVLDLRFVKQKFSRSRRFVIADISVLVALDVGVEETDSRAFVDTDKGVVDRCLSDPERFYLRPQQANTRLKSVVNKKRKTDPAVSYFAGFVRAGRHTLLSKLVHQLVFDNFSQGNFFQTEPFERFHKWLRPVTQLFYPLGYYVDDQVGIPH
jgi:hypothetical protein